MPPVHQTLLSLTATGAGCGADIHPDLLPEEWDELFAITCQQNVTALVCHAIEQVETNIPLVTKLKFATIKEQTISKYQFAQQALSELLNLFSTHGIDTMLLKGFSLSRLYPQPELRHFGDIDYYQYGRWEEADALVSNTFGINVSTQAHHHSKFSYRGILVENHYDFICRYGQKGNGAFERLLKEQAVSSKRPYGILGQPCYLPPQTFAALFYLRHMAAHFAADRITIRHLLDWKFFCQAEGKEADWDFVRRAAQQYGFLPFASAMEEVCRIYFGHSPCLATSSTEGLANRVLTEMLDTSCNQHQLHNLPPLRRLGFKWRRRMGARWKHDICYSAPWHVDLLYGIGAKIVKPHTILH